MLLQRVASARVEIAREIVGSIDLGMLIFVAVLPADDERDADWLIEKLLNLRIFSDANGKMNLSVVDVAGGLLAVSQFTLAGDARRGRRPSFTDAAPPAQAQRLYDYFVDRLRNLAAACSPALQVSAGVFGADMQVHLINDGPVTLLIDSPTK